MGARIFIAFLVLGCDGSIVGNDSGMQPPPAPSPSPQPGPGPGPGSGPAPSPSPSPTPSRVELSSLTPTQLQELYDAFGRYTSTNSVSRPVLAQAVVHWDDTAGSAPANVSVVRGHYAIDHNSDLFFDHHRRYLAEVEAYLATLNLSYAPGGRIPWWDPAKPMPVPFGVVPQPGIDCYTAGRLDNNCDWEYGAFATDFPNMPLPMRFRAGTICQQFATLHDLVQDFMVYHDTVHNTVGGMFRTFDAPAAPIFWSWHATVDDVYSNWLACGK